MTDETTPEVTDTVDNQVTEQVTEASTDNEFGFVLDKYRAEGRSDQESAYEQAKAYTELQKQFGSFTGAPDEYETSIDETAKELGIDIDESAPIFDELKEMGKEMGLNNEGMNKMLNIVAKNALAEMQAQDEALNAELKQLQNGEARINQLNSFLSGSLSGEALEAVQSMPKTAAQIEGLEQLVQLAKGTPTAPTEAVASKVSNDELKSMQFALDEHGNRKMSTDPEFRAEYERKSREVYGSQPHRVSVG